MKEITYCPKGTEHVKVPLLIFVGLDDLLTREVYSKLEQQGCCEDVEDAAVVHTG